MGRRKIEIKPIKDDRNRSVTFLKRKGGLFKKAHELSVLCSVDVAVIIFGSNKKLFEYSSGDMRNILHRYTFHGAANEHKGPSDFNGRADDDDDDDENGSPPQVEAMDPQMLPPHYQSNQPFPPHMRDHTPSASPPIPNGAFVPRGHTPQPGMGSRPSSRNGMRRMGPGMGAQQHVGPPQHAANNYAYMPQPNIYNPQQQPMPPHSMPQSMPLHPQYPYPPPQPHPQTHMQRQMQPFADEHRRSSLPPSFPPQSQAPPPARHSVSPPQPPSHQIPTHPIHHIQPPTPPMPQVTLMRSPPQPPHPLAQQHHGLPIVQEPPPPAPAQPKPEPRAAEPPRRQSLLLDTSVGNPNRGSIFTPVDDNRSILSQHMSVFHTSIRAQSMDAGATAKPEARSSPPQPSSPNRDDGPFRRPQSTQPVSEDRSRDAVQRNGSLTSIPETTIPPPLRSDSLRSAGGVARPRLKVQIPDEASDGGSATNESASPRGTVSTGVTSQRSMVQVLPPPSPSASVLPNSAHPISAGASGPPNPFARPPQAAHRSDMNIDTPISALPSRFLGDNYLPSPSSFYPPEWGFTRGGDGNTNASPINFATPVVGTGPSFLRDDPTPLKRKSPDSSSGHDMDASSEAKRARLES